MKVRELINKLQQFDQELEVKADYIGNYYNLIETDIEVKNEDGETFLAIN